MFDSHEHHYMIGRAYPAQVTVTEQRAPTDQSVRTLREMESAARAEVLKSLRLDGNSFKGVVQTTRDHLSDRDLFRVAFDLNGRRLLVHITRDRGEGQAVFAERLCAAVAAEVATVILGDLFTAVSHW